MTYLYAIKAVALFVGLLLTLSVCTIAGVATWRVVGEAMRSESPAEQLPVRHISIEARTAIAVLLWFTVFLALLMPTLVRLPAPPNGPAVFCCYGAGAWVMVAVYVVRARLDILTYYEQYQGEAVGYIMFWPIVMPIWLSYWLISKGCNALAPAARWLWSGAVGREE